METITSAANTAASAASKAIWGDQTATTTEASGTEPLSGETGNTKKGEPYDAGNITKTDDTTTTDTSDITKKDTIKDTTDPTDTATTDNTKKTSADPTTEHQGAAQPKDDPDPTENQAIKATKQEAEDAAAVDVSGPGPKPLSETHKGTGGAPGPTGVDETDGPQKESRGEGTGEKYIKSSGLKADGGDFDAANAGAGHEADRLLEEKGIHRQVAQTDDAEPSSLDKSEKKSLGEKIKAKFHKDKSDKADKE